MFVYVCLPFVREIWLLLLLFTNILLFANVRERLFVRGDSCEHVHKRLFANTHVCVREQAFVCVRERVFVNTLKGMDVFVHMVDARSTPAGRQLAREASGQLSRQD